jgi:hypothetical protein
MSYEELRGYIRLLETRTNLIDWSAIRADQISASSAGRKMGLQIADAVASGFFKAVEPSSYGHTEDRYARMLKPVVYRRGALFRGYGLKFWPREIETRVSNENSLSWVREFYGPKEK